MRFIIRELSYEEPIAAGQLRYELDGQATNATESWRLTSAVSGYRFLRVDLDAREAPSGRSTLYHLVLNESGRPERLTYRYWDADLKITGNVLLEDEALTATREVNGTRHEDLVMFQANCGFWFPSSIGLGLLANCAQGGVLPAGGPTMAVMLEHPSDDQEVDPESAFALRRVETYLSIGEVEQLDVMAHLMGRSLKAQPLNIRWEDQERTIWLDEHNWPVKMQRNDGLTAVEHRYVRFG